MCDSGKKTEKIFIGLTLLLIAGISAFAQAPVNVIKKAWMGNPSVYFQGIAGNPALSAQVGKDLKNCGWFKAVASTRADYTVSGSASGNSAVLTVNQGGKPYMSVQGRIDPRNVAMSSHKLVDQVLRRLFRIKGICATRLAFLRGSQARHQGSLLLRLRQP